MIAHHEVALADFLALVFTQVLAEDDGHGAIFEDVEDRKQDDLLTPTLDPQAVTFSIPSLVPRSR